MPFYKKQNSRTFTKRKKRLEVTLKQQEQQDKSAQDLKQQTREDHSLKPNEIQQFIQKEKLSAFERNALAIKVVAFLNAQLKAHPLHTKDLKRLFKYNTLAQKQISYNDMLKDVFAEHTDRIDKTYFLMKIRFTQNRDDIGLKEFESFIKFSNRFAPFLFLNRMYAYLEIFNTLEILPYK